MATLGLGLVALLRPSRSFRRANKNSKAGRVPPSMDGDEYTLSLLEEDIVVHESWWCCGPQIAVEEDMVVKLGPLVAVVAVEAAAAASAASAASAAAAAVCCLLSAVCCLLLAAVCCYCCLCCYHVAVHRICSTSLRYREADQLINYIHVLQQQVCE